MKRRTLTKRLIARLGATGKSYLVMDDETRGFGVRVTPSGTKTYVVQYRVPGARQALNARRITVGPVDSLTLDDARAEAQHIKSRVAKGKDPATELADLRDAPTVAALVPVYLEAVRRDRKHWTWYGYRKVMRHDVVPLLGKLRVRDVEHHHVAALKARAGGKIGANRSLAITSAFFGWCEEHGQRPRGTNPVRGVKRHREEPRRRYLTPEEARRLGAAMREALDVGANPYAVAAIRVMLFSGMRAGEVLSLAWSDVDLTTGAVMLRDAKTSERERTLSAPALAVLAELPRENRYVFPSDAKLGTHLVDVGRVWDRIRAAAQLADFRMHDLRHSFASAAISSGATLAVIGELLGHRSAQTTKRYAHLHADARKNAAEKASGALASWMDGKQTKVTPLRRGKHA